MSPTCELIETGRTGGGFPDPERDLALSEDRGEAVLAGGCFWCTEAVYRQLDGVRDVVSGYAGGSGATANYQAVCTGRTGHAEAIRLIYDPTKISFGRLLKVFFSVAHDPTQRNRQGNDVGTQYRSAVFWADGGQRTVAGAYIAQLNRAGVFKLPIATEVEPLQDFFPAETYHQDYAARNPEQAYVAMVATPKVEKLREHFADWLKRQGGEVTS